ncbi:hypothetical protein ACFFV7_50030 [Nonomuraea spiralis]|uniref:Uncharacterized protein n=1 Tax=Nonomuraea spiralis TaxID=46182 RepID=A0ABV5IXW7_9ACTN|nr:hypothetical protein [Nonomuraea spiralis]
MRQLLVDQRTRQIDQDALLFLGRGTPVSPPVAISGADGGLLGFEVVPEFVHQGGRFREGMIDGLDAVAGSSRAALTPVLFHEGRVPPISRKSVW